MLSLWGWLVEEMSQEEKSDNKYKQLHINRPIKMQNKFRMLEKCVTCVLLWIIVKATENLETQELRFGLSSGPVQDHGHIYFVVFLQCRVCWDWLDLITHK